MKTLSNIIFIILLLVATITTYAQHYELENISSKNGLPNNSIQDIYKDSNGTIWLGTNAGLCKYNGKDIKIYTTKDGLSGNKIWGITEDKQGILWIATYGNGVSYYNGVSFYNLELNDTINNNIRTVEYCKKYDCLLFGTDRGLIVKTNKDSILYFNHQTLDIERFQVIAIQQIGELYNIYTYGQLTYIFNPKTNTLTKYGKHSERDFKYIASGIINNNGDTIVGYHRNYTAILKQDSIVRFENTGQVFDMCKGDNDEIWLAGWDVSLVGDNGGLFKIQGDSLVDYTDIYKIPTRAIWSLYYDTLEKTLFVGTMNKGLFIYKNKSFEYIDLDIENLQINHMKWVNNSLWIASDNYFISFRNKMLLKIYDKNYFSKIAKNKHHQLYKNKDSKLLVTYINTNEKNELFFASRGGCFKYKKHNFNYYVGNVEPFVFFNDKLFTVGWGHLYEYYDLNNLSKKIKHNTWKENTPVDIRKIIEHNNKIWFLSWAQGLFLKENEKYTWFNKTISDIDNDIIDITFDKNDNIYIAQNNGELLVTEYLNDSLIIRNKLSCNSEIKGNALKWVICNKQNQLFVGTDYGLNYINLNQNTDHDWNFRYYNKKEGYTAFESSQAIEDSIGNIWVNTNTGLLKINAKDFDNFSLNQVVRITGVDLFNNSADSLLQIINPNFAYNQNYLTFHFQRNNYINADKDIYYYRLKGFSEKWNASTNNSVDYFNLRNGEYSFEIKCFNTNTRKYSNVATYEFAINKAWWTTIWFYIILFFIIGITIWMYVWIRIRKITKEAEETSKITKRIAEMEMQALQSQMNPHFVFNSINSIQNFILDGNIDDTLTYLAHFSTLLRGTLSYASEKYISIQQEQDFLNHYLALEQMRFVTDKGNSFKFEFIIDEALDIDSKIIPPMLMQPVIENSIKHGEIHKASDGKVIIEIKIDNGLLLCSVTDNGLGRAKSESKKNKHHHSKGISIIEDRINLLSDNSNTGIQIIDLDQGTRVELRMSLNI